MAETKTRTVSKSMQMTSEILADVYQSAFDAKKNGKLVAWSTSIFPQELPEVFDIQVLYPENHSAALAAKKEAPHFIADAESKGYSIDVCSYAKTNLSYKDLLESENLNMPRPDLMLCCNNICNQVLKWYENIAKELDIPMILIDTAYNYEYNVTPSRVQYIKEQLLEAIARLEEITGKKFDEAKFKEIMKISMENSTLWEEAMSMTYHKPSPMNGLEMFNYMALVVCRRGRKETGEVFKQLKKELQERIDTGTSSFPGEEKYRIYWDGIACWPALSHNAKFMIKNGINMVASSYPKAWAIFYETDDLDSMARAYSSIGNNMTFDRLADRRVLNLEKFDCDGMIYHMNRSCKVMDLTHYEMQKAVFARTGVPYASFDGDQADARSYSPAQFETRIQGLIEMMEERKREKAEKEAKA